MVEMNSACLKQADAARHLLEARDFNRVRLHVEGADPAPFRKEIHEGMTDSEFAVLVNRYLYSFGLTGHLQFFEQNPNRPKPAQNAYYPFFARRHGNGLYIVSVHKNSTYSKGDVITALDGMTVEEAEKKYYWIFPDKDPERQVYLWNRLIDNYIKKLTVIRKDTGKAEEIEYRCFSKNDESMSENKDFFFKKLSEDTALIRFPNFMHEEPVNEIFAEFRKFIKKGNNVIFDVRHNEGGNDSFFHPFRKYLFPEGKNIFCGKNSADQTYYSERNCKEFVKTIESTDYPRKEKDRIIKKRMEMSGKGWYPVYGRNEDFLVSQKGRKNPENVYILTDEYCGSSGDSFVDFFSMSEKVTVIGRPTAGINDYSNVCMVQYGDMAFMYPMSRCICINDGIRHMGKGHPVDIYVPWTPEHIERDVMLEKTLEIIAQKNGVQE